eukprot:1161762-Pelagomonas_calceolata.AAC.11
MAQSAVSSLHKALRRKLEGVWRVSRNTRRQSLNDTTCEYNIVRILYGMGGVEKTHGQGARNFGRRYECQVAHRVSCLHEGKACSGCMADYLQHPHELVCLRHLILLVVTTISVSANRWTFLKNWLPAYPCVFHHFSTRGKEAKSNDTVQAILQLCDAVNFSIGAQSVHSLLQNGMKLHVQTSLCLKLRKTQQAP